MNVFTFASLSSTLCRFLDSPDYKSHLSLDNHGETRGDKWTMHKPLVHEEEADFYSSIHDRYTAIQS